MHKVGITMLLTSKIARKFLTLSYWGRTRKKKNLGNGRRKIKSLRKKYKEAPLLLINGKIIGKETLNKHIKGKPAIDL